MSLQTHHTILKHYLQLDLKMERGETVLADVQALVKEKIELHMEAIFNEFCSEDVVMQFDRIYLDLGVLDSSQLNEALVPAYCYALRHFFEQKVGFEKNLSFSHESIHGEISVTGQMTVTEKIQKDILHFFNHGYWALLSSYRVESYDLLILEQLKQDTSFARRVLEIISKNKNAAARFGLQSIPEVFNIIQITWKERLKISERANLKLLNLLLSRSFMPAGTDGSTIQVQLMAMPFILKQSSEMVKWIKSTDISSSRLFRQQLEMLFSSGYFKDNSINDEVIIYWQEVLISLSMEPALKTINENDLINKEYSNGANAEEKPDNKTEESVSLRNAERHGKQQLSNELPLKNDYQDALPEKNTLLFDHLLPGLINIPGKHDSSLTRRMPDDIFFISNAGLVLLHPFLPAFFKTIGLTENDAFRNTGSIHRAIHLLEYLANGSEQPFEAGLIFNKVLCGWPVDMPLTRFIGLDEKEKNEAHSLLKAVIKHWSALKSSSPEALQQAFLTRTGKLVDDAGIWQIKVESSGLDILLSQLPWSISVVKLPWMTGHIIVDWN